MAVFIGHILYDTVKVCYGDMATKCDQSSHLTGWSLGNQFIDIYGIRILSSKVLTTKAKVRECCMKHTFFPQK